MQSSVRVSVLKNGVGLILAESQGLVVDTIEVPLVLATVVFALVAVGQNPGGVEVVLRESLLDSLLDLVLDLLREV
jgi:hypothetical protein